MIIAYKSSSPKKDRNQVVVTHTHVRVDAQDSLKKLNLNTVGVFSVVLVELKRFHKLFQSYIYGFVKSSNLEISDFRLSRNREGQSICSLKTVAASHGSIICNW